MPQVKNHRITFIVGALLLMLTAYTHGYRLADMSEVPASHRPSSIIVAGNVDQPRESHASGLSSLWKD